MVSLDNLLRLVSKLNKKVENVAQHSLGLRSCATKTKQPDLNSVLYYDPCLARKREFSSAWMIESWLALEVRIPKNSAHCCGS